ncbi:SMI1/KNR4 family protein [Myxococcus llanfairpwllgwyngyllgogerychwyrndrobwllllantysiliogogogochensis]|uniref:SMI1/KNR4 family protein n=1 Tax=Myxococcus llanfairpwllgwyngyllgogerychwyrndrobwllllantysiliogogogochensis TaxID=2590453 RepID=A0A540WW97_9BACT|nr:SMI1/KNR4 family protein [Myxococcus llanfairpwllgwyngyllgogerychwyrndrobwllllantysiliogogogochensis]
MEGLLLRVVPGLAAQWRGVTSDTIASVERLAGQPLPSFYRWFLSRMGPLAYPTLDFSAQRVLACYARKQVLPDSRFLLIAFESDEMMPLHLFYDFSAPSREDALVTSREARGGELTDRFETLREMLAWGAVSLFRIDRAPQTLSGSIKGDAPDFLSRLDPVMDSLGFTASISTGPLCRVYERPDAAMVCRGTPRAGLGNMRTFKLGGSNVGSLRRILGEIATEPSLELAVKGPVAG